MTFRPRVVVVGALGFLLSACSAVDQINEQLQAAKGELQAKRALTLSESTLKDLKRIDIALGVRPETLERLKPRLLHALNSSKRAKKESISFQNVAFSMDTQMLSLEVQLTKKIADFVVTGQLQASSFVGATSNALVWNLYADGIKVTKVDGANAATEQGIKLVVDGVRALLPILNSILDEAVNDDADKAIMLVFDNKDLIRKELSEGSSQNFKIDKKELVTGLQTQAAAVVIEKGGLFAAAQVEFVRPEQVQPRLPTFPKDSELIRMSSDDWKSRAEAYRKAVVELAGGSKSEDLRPLTGYKSSGMAVTREALARLVNFNLSQGAVSGTLIMNKPMKEQKTTLTMDIKRRDCHRYFAACDFKHICEGNKCIEEFNKVINTTCEVDCCLKTGLLGCIFRGICKRPCQKLTKATRAIQGSTCDAFRTASSLHGGLLCSMASNVDKAACDVQANVRKSMCDVEQGVAKFYEKNPVATVTANATPNARFKLAVTEASVSSDLNSLHATVSGGGGGTIHASIKYDRHNYADAIVLGPGVSLGVGCAADWKESVDVDARAQPLRERLTFAIAINANPDKTVVLDLRQQGEKIIKVDFDPPPLIALFGGKPQVTLNCPLAALGAVVFASGERVFKEEDARKVLPLLTGKGYPIEVKELNFSLRLKPITVCDEKKQEQCAQPLVVLDPDVSGQTIRYLERRP